MRPLPGCDCRTCSCCLRARIGAVVGDECLDQSETGSASLLFVGFLGIFFVVAAALSWIGRIVLVLILQNANARRWGWGSPWFSVGKAPVQLIPEVFSCAVRDWPHVFKPAAFVDPHPADTRERL